MEESGEKKFFVGSGTRTLWLHFPPIGELQDQGTTIAPEGAGGVRAPGRGGGLERAEMGPGWVGTSSRESGFVLGLLPLLPPLTSAIAAGDCGSHRVPLAWREYLSFFPLPFFKVGVKRVRIGVGWPGALRVRREEAATATGAAGSRRHASCSLRSPALPASALRMWAAWSAAAMQNRGGATSLLGRRWAVRRGDTRPAKGPGCGGRVGARRGRLQPSFLPAFRAGCGRGRDDEPVTRGLPLWGKGRSARGLRDRLTMRRVACRLGRIVKLTSAPDKLLSPPLCAWKHHPKWRISYIPKSLAVWAVFLGVAAFAPLLAHRFIAPPNTPLSPATQARAI